jgi:hypothetical protein
LRACSAANATCLDVFDIETEAADNAGRRRPWRSRVIDQLAQRAGALIRAPAARNG